MSSVILSCFYCNADSKSLLIFFLLMIGSLVFATVFFGIGFMLRGQFKNAENSKFDVFLAEERH